MTLEQLQQAIATYRVSVTDAADLEDLQDMLQEEVSETESQMEILEINEEEDDEVDTENDDWTPDPTIWSPEDIAQLRALGLNI